MQGCLLTVSDLGHAADGEGEVDLGAAGGRADRGGTRLVRHLTMQNHLGWAWPSLQPW